MEINYHTDTLMILVLFVPSTLLCVSRVNLHFLERLYCFLYILIARIV